MMHLSPRLPCIIALLISSAAVSPQDPAERTDRAPLEKRGGRLESPINWAMRERVDPTTGQVVEYDPLPRVVTVNARAGLYDLRWVGIDGDEKSIQYQRPDAIDVVVRADVRVLPSGVREFTYQVENLASSGQSLTGFTVQTRAEDARPVVEELVFSRMGDGILGAGQWWRFRARRHFAEITPGETGEFMVLSRAMPGLVDCVVDGGRRGMTGVGEEMPTELERQLPGYEAWPRGGTIGPVQRLSNMSTGQRVEQLIEWLPQFDRLGWMTTDARTRYGSTARRDGLGALLAMLDADLTAERITTEVAAIIRGLSED